MRIFLSIVQFVVFAGLCAHENPFLTSFEAARTKALAENKILLVDMQTSWCGWCRVLEKTTYRDSSVLEMIDEHFVPVSLNAEVSGEGYNMATRYGVMSYPTIIYLEPDGRVLHFTGGYMEPVAYLEELKTVVERHQKAEYYAGYGAETPSFPPFYLTYFKKDDNPRIRVQTPVIDSFYQHTHLQTEEAFLVMKIFGPRNLSFDSVKSALAGYYPLYPENEVIDIPYSFISNWLKKQDSTDASVLLKLDTLIAEIGPKNPEISNFWTLMFRQDVYEKSGNWSAYALEYDSYRKKQKTKNNNTDNTQAWNLYLKCSEHEPLMLALNWMKEVTGSSDDYAYWDTYASLLYALKYYHDAEIAALKAIESGTLNGDDTSETKKLLQENSGSPEKVISGYFCFSAWPVWLWLHC